MELIATVLVGAEGGVSVMASGAPRDPRATRSRQGSRRPCASAFSAAYAAQATPLVDCSGGRWHEACERRDPRHSQHARRRGSEELIAQRIEVQGGRGSAGRLDIGANSLFRRIHASPMIARRGERIGQVNLLTFPLVDLQVKLLDLAVGAQQHLDEQGEVVVHTPSAVEPPCERTDRRQTP